MGCCLETWVDLMSDVSVLVILLLSYLDCSRVWPNEVQRVPSCYGFNELISTLIVVE
jgi:hypothetical protein